MGTPTTTPLLDRIESRRPLPEPERIGNRRPVWLRRMDERGLPPKDMSNLVFLPTGQDAA